MRRSSLPPILATGRRYVSRALKDLDRILSPLSKHNGPPTPKKGRSTPPLNTKDEVLPEPESDASRASSESNYVRDLVCQDCLEGLFSSEAFQQAWTSSGLHEGFSYTSTWTQVQVSAERGCQWCKIVHGTKTDAMQRKHILQVTVGIRTSPSSARVTPKGVQVLKLTINGTFISEYYVYTDRDDPAASQIVARSPLLEVRAPLARKMAVECIADCIKNHPQCTPPQDAALPTRVVDCSDPTRPKLRLRNGERARYVALSYIAGSSPSFSDVDSAYAPSTAQGSSNFPAYCTTTRNTAQYRTGIDSMLLPRTLRDAIMTTHLLGIQYLWVDALCVLQDSPDDRAREASRTRGVFRNAYLTIVAASARHPSEGFLHDRPDRAAADPHLPLPLPTRDVGPNASFRLQSAAAARQFQFGGAAEPTAERGEGMAEQLLAPRALVYASHTLQFLCQTAVQNIGSAVCVALPPPSGACAYLPRLPDALFRPDADFPLTSARDLGDTRRAWAHAVADYTGRALARPQDRLPALAPLADAFQRAWRTEYLAGLWRATLPRDLLWRKDPATRYPRPLSTSRRAPPSWSWGAVEGKVVPLLAVAGDTVGETLAEEEERAPGTPPHEPHAVRACTVVSCTGVGVGSASRPGSPTPASSRPTSPLGRRSPSPSPPLPSALSSASPSPLSPSPSPPPPFPPAGTLTLRTAARRAVWDPAADAPTDLLLHISGRHAGGHTSLAAAALPKQIRIGHAWPDAVEREPDALVADVWAVPVLWDERREWVAGLVVALVAPAPGEEGVVRPMRFRRVGYFQTPEDSSGGLAWMDQPAQDMVIV